MAKWTISEQELAAQRRQAMAAARQAEQREPRAQAVRYLRATDRLRIDLTNGATILIPIRQLEGLSEATAKECAQIEVIGGGFSLHWPALDRDLSVSGLVAGLFGSRAWMSALARAAGRVSSAAKARAARENGKKGGRPPASDRRAA